jgi:hypothetical protein
MARFACGGLVVGRSSLKLMVSNWSRDGPAPSIIEGRPWTVMQESTCHWNARACDTNGKIVREDKIASEPEALIAWFASLGYELARIGLEAGPLSQWLYATMKQAGLAVELLETRRVRDAFSAMPVKSDRNDARGIAQLMRLGSGVCTASRSARSRYEPC